MDKVRMPDTQDAQVWLDPDTFIYQGQVYHVEASGKVVQDVELERLTEPG